MKSGRVSSVPALTLMEEAFHLVRRAPIGALAAYYAGSLPFVLALLYFFLDMKQRTANDEACAQAAFGLALLFIWMKVWQTIFARRLFSEVRGEGDFPWTLRRLARMATTQAILQTLALITMPLALLALVPFGWAYALYQNITVLGDGEEPRLRAVVRRAARLAGMWTRQNLLCIWIVSPVLIVFGAFAFGVLLPFLTASAPDPVQFFISAIATLVAVAGVFLCPFGLLLAINIASAIMLLPYLLRTLFGVDTVFVLSGLGPSNPSFLIVVCGLTYLLLDPFAKAVYVLRCFYGESVATGEDLKVGLRRFPRGNAITRIALLALTVCAGCFSAHAATLRAGTPASHRAASPTTAVSPNALDHAITGVLTQRVYAWRLPRQKTAMQPGLIVRFTEAVRDTLVDWLRAIHRVLRRLLDWINRLDKTPHLHANHSPFQWRYFIDPALYIALAGLLCAVIIMGWRTWTTRSRIRTEPATPAPAPTPDIEDEGVMPTELPEDGWVTMAREFTDRGEYRLALRALFLSSLAHLAQKELVRVAKFKSNRDYHRELTRRAHALPGLHGVFGRHIEQFECVWYGTEKATRRQVDQFFQDLERIRYHAS